MPWRNLVRLIPDFPAPGVQFRDLIPVMADPDGWNELIDEFAHALARFECDVVLAPEARGFLLAAPLSYRLGTALVPVRKAGKLPPPTLEQRYALEYGDAALEVEAQIDLSGRRVVVIDDVLATGGTALAVVRLARELGAKVTGCAFAIELALLDGRSRLPVPVHALWRLDH